MKYLAMVLLLSVTAYANEPTSRPTVLRDVGIDQKLGEQVPAGLIFKDEAGKTVHLGDYFGRRPVILAMVYYKCPMLCTMVLNELTRSLNAMSLTAGNDFDVLAVSFDPRETPDLAAQKKRNYLREYHKQNTEAGWHFLTGPADSISTLTKAVGFRYAWDAEHQVFAHASGIMVLTPQGKLSRYFFGIDYLPADLRMALVEASGGSVGGLTDTVMLYCFQYDPKTGRYSMAIWRLVQAGGALMLLLIGAAIGVMLLRERRRSLKSTSINPTS